MGLKKFMLKKGSLHQEEINKKLQMIEHEQDSDKSSDRDEMKESDWKNEQYYLLPENVRIAIDSAKMK